MTIIETIKGFPGLADLSTAMLEKVCTDREILSGIIYSAEYKTVVNLAIADALMAAANNPDFSEKDLSVKIDRERMIKAANRLYEENGEGFRILQQPKIRNRTNFW